MTTYLRYFATTDDTELGRMGLEYLKSMLRVGPVRVLSMSGGMFGPWAPYAQLLGTPVSYPFVNVVCAEPARWTWRQVVATDKDPVDGRVELYTAGVRNVLLAGPGDPPGVLTAQAATAMRFEALVVPTTRLLLKWGEVGKSLGLLDGTSVLFSPTLIPVPPDHDLMRAALMG